MVRVGMDGVAFALDRTFCIGVEEVLNQYIRESWRHTKSSILTGAKWEYIERQLVPSSSLDDKMIRSKCTGVLRVTVSYLVCLKN
jgi:hypothetical protein